MNGLRRADDDGGPSRRTLLRAAAGLGIAAAAGPLLAACSSGGDPSGSTAAGTQAGKGSDAEPPPETTSIRLPNIFPNTCLAALAVAEPYLREEGFTDVSYVRLPLAGAPRALAGGELDFAGNYAPWLMADIEAGAPIVMLSGLHAGCWQLFAAAGIRSLRDFKGKTIAFPAPLPESTFKAFLAATLATVGIDLREDVRLVGYEPANAAASLKKGQVDGLLAFPPLSLDLRAKRIGAVVLNSAVDRPWSNYFCCMAYVNRGWMETHPVAARRALRAVLRAADVVDTRPGHAAHVQVDAGFTDNLAYAEENLREIPYDVWRRFDPADTIRFYALRMKEVGLIKATPEQMIRRGTDFSHLATLKRELVRAG